MSFYFQRWCSFSLYFGISRKHQEYILDDYQHAWDVNNESVIRSCEQKLIELNKKTLVGYLQQFVIKQSESWEFDPFNKQTENKYASCVLHLTHVFCIPGQEEKIKVVQVELNKMLQYCKEEERFAIFERYLSQRLKVKSSLTEIDLLTDQIDHHNEFLLKLCYWDIFCAKRNNECCKEFLQQNVDYLVSNIERSFQVENLEEENIIYISCTMLLCLLNWNICKTQNPVILQNDMDPPASSSFALVADESVSYSCTAHKVSNILQIVWSTLSKDDISTVFNNYINKMDAMKTDLREDDFCTDKIEPYFEFILKLCCWDYLCIKNDFERCKAFLRRNLDLFVSQIEELVSGNKTKTKAKIVSCKLLLCLLNWNICKLKTFIGSHFLNGEKQQSCTMNKVRCVLEKLLSTLTDNDISEVINGYIDQMYAMKQEITPEGLCIGAAVLHHEYKLKQIYWETIYRKNDYEAHKNFIQMCPDILVSHIEKQILYIEGKKKRFYCRTLLCFLNWNICTSKTAPLMAQKTEIQATVADSQPKDSPTEETVRRILQNYLLTFSKKEIFITFNDYLKQMNTMNSEITEAGFCTGKIEPFHEFMLKLCYFEKLWIERDDDEVYKEFLTRNADLFVSQIGKVIESHGKNTHTKLVSCKILLCLLNWNICNLKSTFIQSEINSDLQESYSFQSGAENTTKSECTMYEVKRVLKNILSSLTDKDILKVFNGYIYQMYALKSEITNNGLCIGETEPHHHDHEFKLKLCYWERICSENNNEAYKKFIQMYPDFLASYIEEDVKQTETQTKMSYCKTLLCILNWNAYHQKTSTPLNFQNCLFTSKVKKSTKYQNTIYKVRNILEKVLSILSEDEIFEAFNKYLRNMYAMKSEITEADFCTGKIRPYHEFLLKLCHCEKLCYQSDVETLKTFLRRNADLFLSKIEKVVHGNKTKHLSCKVLLCLLNWKICSLKTTFVSSQIQNSEIKSCSLQMEAENTTKSACTVYKIRSVLQNLLSSLTHNDIFKVFNGYIYQMYICTMKSEISPDGLCIGETETQHELDLKLCYLEAIWRKKDYAAYKTFIQLYPEVLVSNIKERIDLCQGTKQKRFYCKILLCILNRNICTSTTAPPLVQKAEIQASSSIAIADSPPKYLSTAKTIRNILQQSLSTFSEEEILTLFNSYIDLLYAMNSEITEADFCTGKIEPYHEFMMKLCYCEKLGTEVDDENYRKFLRRNADFLVLQIKEVVDKKNTKTKVISCQVLLCLLKWDICSGKTAYIPPKNILSQMLAQNTDCQDFMNENAHVFISMQHTKIKRNNIPVLIILCDVLLRIPYNTCHFQDVTSAINKLIRYYAKQVGIDERICEWIILLGHRLLKYTKHTQDIQNNIATEETNYDFQMLKNFLSDLFTKAMHVGTNFDLLINTFRKVTNLYGDYENEDGILNYDILNAEDDHINKLWRAKLTCKVKIIQISNNIRKKNKNLPFKIEEDKNCLEFYYAQLNFIDTFEEDVKEDQLKVKTLEDQIKAILIIDEMVKKFQLSEMLVLLMMLLTAGTSNGHHKSAKLKKYLSLKYEYDKASLYLLWCSGDIEVHPGPSMNKKTLTHDSSIERRWIQNLSPKILVLLPEHEQSKYKPTKKVKKDRENRDHFNNLLKTCLEESIPVPKMYLAEINAWKTMKYTILHKLFVFRCENEIIMTSLQDIFTCGGSTIELTAFNISFDTEPQTYEITTILGKDQRPTDKSQLLVYITRFIAGIAIKCAHQKDPDAKCDGLWDLPLKNWRKDIILFDPNNRGKYTTPGQKLIPDQELVDMLLKLPQVTIPQKYKEIVEAFRTMRKSQKDKSINKQHKAELCSTFKRITSLEKLDYALKNLWESGIFTEEVHYNLNKWWTTGAVDTPDQNVSQFDIMEVQKSRRPHIFINISTKSVTLTVEQTDAKSSQVRYDIPLKDELVPLKTMATTVHQTTIQKPSSDSYQMITAKQYLTVSSKQDACPTDNQINSIIFPPLGLNPNGHAILESDIKHQHKISTEETALCSTIDFDQPTSSTKQISQLSQNIATPNQSTTNSDDTSSATKNSQSLDFHTQVSPTSDLGSSDSISSVNSESGNDDGDQNNTLNEGQDPLTYSDYSSDSSNNCVPKTGLKKRKCIEEDRIEMKKRKIPSLKEDKKQSDPTNHRKDDSSMDNSTIFNTNMELLQDCLQIDLDSFVFDDQTFDVKLNALDYEDKNPQICDKDGNLMNGETQMSNENTNISAYNTSISTILEKFVQDMINKEHEKMSQMKTSLSEV